MKSKWTKKVKEIRRWQQRCSKAIRSVSIAKSQLVFWWAQSYSYCAYYSNECINCTVTGFLNPISVKYQRNKHKYLLLWTQYSKLPFVYLSTSQFATICISCSMSTILLSLIKETKSNGEKRFILVKNQMAYSPPLRPVILSRLDRWRRRSTITELLFPHLLRLGFYLT